MEASQWEVRQILCPTSNLFQQQYIGQKYSHYLVGRVNYLMIEFSTVLYKVRSVLKFDYSLVINWTPNLWRLVESNKPLDKAVPF